MAASATRLLLLGSVLLFEPVNGYQVRRELLSWEVDRWAHIKPGSIYSGLGTLARQGHLTRHDIDDGGREVAVYTSTQSGRNAFRTLYAEALGTVDPFSPLPFHTALALMPLMPRDQVIGLLRRRLASIDAGAGEPSHAPKDPTAVPPHVLAIAELWGRLGQVERDWVIELLARLEAGQYALAGEDLDWQIRADDPGWQMVDDRVRYQRILDRS